MKNPISSPRINSVQGGERPKTLVFPFGRLQKAGTACGVAVFSPLDHRERARSAAIRVEPLPVGQPIDTDWMN